MDKPPPDTRERTEGPTPTGGAYAIAYFRDARGNPCTKAEAHATEIIEFDARDNQVFRTYMQRPGDTPVPI
jgi:hypothetical protein